MNVRSGSDSLLNKVPLAFRGVVFDWWLVKGVRCITPKPEYPTGTGEKHLRVSYLLPGQWSIKINITIV